VEGAWATPRKWPQPRQVEQMTSVVGLQSLQGWRSTTRRPIEAESSLTSTRNPTHFIWETAMQVSETTELSDPATR